MPFPPPTTTAFFLSIPSRPCHCCFPNCPKHSENHIRVFSFNTSTWLSPYLHSSAEPLFFNHSFHFIRPDCPQFRDFRPNQSSPAGINCLQAAALLLCGLEPAAFLAQKRSAGPGKAQFEKAADTRRRILLSFSLKRSYFSRHPHFPHPSPLSDPQRPPRCFLARRE